MTIAFRSLLRLRPDIWLRLLCLTLVAVAGVAWAGGSLGLQGLAALVLAGSWLLAAGSALRCDVCYRPFAVWGSGHTRLTTPWGSVLKPGQRCRRCRPRSV